MSDSDVLTRHLGRVRGLGREPEVGDSAEDYGCFSFLRGVGERAPMLELRRRSGDILAISYAWLEEMEFSPSSGIVLRLPGRKVRIIGRGLNAETRPRVRLFEGLTRHRVTWVKETDDRLDEGRQACIVEGLEW